MALRYADRPNWPQQRARPVRRPRHRPVYRYATLVWHDGDRNGRAVCQDGEQVDVIIPNGMWSAVGQRIALTRYPDGWVLAKLVIGR